MSSEIYELMKRSDEAHVVEKAHRRPRFVEDCVREMISGVVERVPDLRDEAFVSARQENLETIHQHNVIAERFGTLGEIRRELQTACPRRATRPAGPGSTPSSPEPDQARDARVVLERQGEPLKVTTLPDPSRGRDSCASRRRLRRLPHRPAPARRGDRGHQAAGRARPSDRRADRRRPPRRRALARLDRRRVPLLPERPREPVRRRALHRPRHRRRLRRADRRRRALLPPAPRRPDRRAGGAAAVRRPDRLPGAADGRRRAAARPVRVRLGRAHDLPGRPSTRDASVRVHAAGRRRAQAFAR